MCSEQPNKNKPTILIARPGAAGSKLCERLKEQNYHAIHFPTICFAPPDDLNQFQRELTALADTDWAIFISPQAVAASLPAILAYYKVWPKGCRIAAVGEATKKALEVWSLAVAACPLQSWGSEDLLALPELQHVGSKKIVIVKGHGGRELLFECLRDRGANIHFIQAYRRQLPKTDARPIQQLILEKKINAIVCSSFEMVANLKKLLSASWEQLKTIPLIVISERIKCLAENLGFVMVYVAENASDLAIIAAVNRINFHDK